MSNKYKIIWGGYKNTTIPKMLREAYDPEGHRSRGGGGAYSGLTIPTPEHTEEIIAPPTVTPGNLPLTISFTNRSIGEDSTHLWNFGDGTTSTELHPVHTYTTAGTYTVKLTVTNIIGSNTKTVTDAIIATAATVADINEPAPPTGDLIDGEEDLPRRFTLILNRDPPSGGTVSGGGTYNAGTSVNISAVPNSAWTFLDWQGETIYPGVLNIVSYVPDATIIMDKNKTITARFTGTLA